MEDYKKEFELLKEQHNKSKPVHGIQAIHSFIPVLINKALIKQCSASDKEKLVV